MARQARRPPADIHQHALWATLLLITVAEMLTAAVLPQAGIIMHAALLVALLISSGVAERPAVRNLALGLALAPMIRLLSLSLPLVRLPQMAWYPAVSTLLLITLALIARAVGQGRASLGLRLGSVPLQLALALVGPGLGALEYLILRPAPQPAAGWVGVALMSLSLLIFTGLAEELIFRGLLQNLARPVMGRWGLVYVSALFGVLHIGYLSLTDVIFAAAVGYAFAQLVRLSGSLLGVTLAHGLTNITLFLALPALAAGGAPLEDLLGALVLSGAAALVVVGGILTLQAGLAGDGRPAAGSRVLRAARYAQGLTYFDLAARSGLTARRLAEAELGVGELTGEELGMVAGALQLAPEQLRGGA